MAVTKPSNVDRWMRQYLLRLDLKIQRERLEAKLSDYRAQRTAHRRWKEQQQIDAARTLAKSSVATVAHRETWFRSVAWDLVRPGTESLVRLWRAHIDEIARIHKIQVEYVAAIRGVNGYAFFKVRRIEISPIHNAEAYATALHECGHCIAPHEDRVRSEILAWQWAMQYARPTWTREMHHEMATALPSYRKYGTEAEQQEIDRLVSTMSYCDTRLRRAREGVSHV